MRTCDLERNRTIIKQRIFYNNTIDDIKRSQRKINNARLRKGLYKCFFEEFSILLEYTELKYKKNNSITFKWVGKKQQGQLINYDGEIYKNGNLIERIEITCPLISKQYYIKAKELNKNGFSTPEVGDLQNTLDKIYEKIQRIANKKNNKNTYNDTITLVIYMEDYEHFFENIDICEKILIHIQEDLNKIPYKFNEVYLLKNITDKKNLIRIF